MELFMPDIVYIDPHSQKYEVGIKAKEYFIRNNIPIIETKNVVIDGNTPNENYAKSKRTILLTVNKQKKLDTCKPSADYEFHISSSCPGNCEYCYLQTTQGKKPFMKLFVNIEEILEVVQKHIDENIPHITTFESGSITDPIALEHITGNIKRCIEFFGKSEYGRLRVITKFSNVDSLLGINHNFHTKFRFSINTDYIISKFEHNTGTFEERMEAVKKIANAGYPLGFIIAPIMIYDNWKDDYKKLIFTLKDRIKHYQNEITFELIQHRFTKAAKELILKRFPNTKLDLNEETRQLKWGPYGKFKYVYTKEKSEEIRQYISELIMDNFKNAVIEYFT